jgi:general secretion pathway protein G
MKTKKHPITLIEIMVVIFLISLIGGVIGYNVKGSLEEGKKFKTEQAQERIRDVLLLEVAKGKSIDEVIKNHRQILEDSGFVKNVDEYLKDGWNFEYEIKSNEDKDDIDIISMGLENYHKKHAKPKKRRNKTKG